ncbi:MAG TPA: helix-turn-helix domain-containing protein [Clostridiaceae bacterium]|jgi:AraC family transcriptional regulator|nr:helix-turn-helix domain-containing protein [Clostridiaceae bacterium]
MKNFMILADALNFIEQNLCEPIARQDIAKHCYVSLSSLEKLFRYAVHFSIKDYITRRRMTQAAKDIYKYGMRVTDAALKYQYNSVEVFSRAFKRVWGVKPSEFKENWNFTGIFPKINYEYRKGDDFNMARKRVDMSEAYDYLKEARGSYVLCFDIQNLTTFNNISTKAGDIAILEAASRIDKVATDEMIMLRVGGDEFALVTGLYDLDKAKEIADKVLGSNGKPIVFEGKKLPLSLWCGITTIPETLRYSELFTEMHVAINASKK